MEEPDAPREVEAKVKARELPVASGGDGRRMVTFTETLEIRACALAGHDFGGRSEIGNGHADDLDPADGWSGE